MIMMVTKRIPITVFLIVGIWISSNTWQCVAFAPTTTHVITKRTTTSVVWIHKEDITDNDNNKHDEMSVFFELAHEIADEIHDLEEHKKHPSWNDQHLVHAASELHDQSDTELRESEEAAAWDAHDCSDPGMEAAAEERAVMLANEFMHKAKEEALRHHKKQQTTPSSSFLELAHEIADELHDLEEHKKHPSPSWNDQHLVHAASELHEETDTELRESEEAAAWDAHDCSDPGMEAAAEERAVMLANELMHKAKGEAAKNRQKQNKNNDGEVRP